MMDTVGPPSFGRPLLLGHRGCRGAYPENSIKAFDHALAAGCDGFEFDVRLTGDGKGLVWHDAALCKLAINTTSYAELINKSMSSRMGRFWRKPQAQPCLLDDVLERYSGRAFLNIELKVPGAEELTAELCRRWRASDVVVSSFLPEVITRFSAIAPQIAVGFIFDRRVGLEEWRKIDTQYLMPNHRLLKPEVVSEMRSAGRQVIAWTVNDKRRMAQLAAWGIDGLISDDPVLLSNSFGGKRTP